MLGPGESLKAAATAMYAPGVEDTGAESGGVTFDPINGLDVSAWNRSAGVAISGVTLSGPPTSTAATIIQAFKGNDTLVVTSHRVLVMDFRPPEVITVKGEWPRADIADIAWDPRLFQHGRLRIVAADGSLVRLMCGLLLPGAAKRLAAAWR